jgi:hypothetical protein
MLTAQPNARVAGHPTMKSVAVIRQRTSIRPSVPGPALDSVRRESRADRAEMVGLRRAAARIVLSRRSVR